MHTYTSKIRDFFKDQGEEHFQFCYKNVNVQEMQEGVDEYVKYEACFLAKLEFVWHIAISWKELQHFANAKWKRKLKLLL